MSPDERRYPGQILTGCSVDLRKEWQTGGHLSHLKAPRDVKG